MRLLLGVVLVVGACGGDAKPMGKPPALHFPAPGDSSSPRASAATSGKEAKFTLYPQAPAEYRKALTQDDFVADPTGDLNRDPFRSYLVDNTTATATVAQSPQSNRCSRGVVAEDSGIRDMVLWGIVQEGTRGYAWFSDSKKLGQQVKEGDCLTRDKAIVKDISAGCVTLEIQPEALTGPAPAPHDERVCLHPEDLTEKVQ
jgi:hypothetical protein